MNKARFTLAAVLWAIGCITSQSAILYVAPDGNDKWSGRIGAPAQGDGPLLTMPTALRAARKAREQKDDAVTIFLRGGTYELTEPLVLGPEDSGSDAQRPFTIAAYRDEKPVISGGRRITGWRPVPGKGNWWQAQVPAVGGSKASFRQLFVNGQRKQRARTPNQGYYRIQGPSSESQPVKFKFKPGEIKKAWAESGDVEVIALLAWADLRMQIRAVDETNTLVTLSGNPQPSNKEGNAQYYIENAADALDQPGEWYLDTKQGVVSYWAEPGEDLAKAEVIASRLEELVVLQGDFSGKKPVKHVVFHGLTFSHTDWTLGPNGYADTQAAINVNGDVRAEGAVDCRVEDCVFTHLAGYALELGRGCQRWAVIGNQMFDLGAGGVRVGETEQRSEAFEANQGHIITDNAIHHGGVIFPAGVGVFVLQSGKNRIAHNHIHHLYYTAVSLGWNWGYQETPCRENIVEFNHMHDIGQGLLSDMGAVYTLGIQKGTAIRNNVIHDVSAFTYGGWGLYPDEGSTDIEWENNVVYRCKSAGFHQHYGRDNIVRNNIFALNKETQVMRTRAESHISFHFTNNIVYFDSGNLLGSNWSNDNYRMDRNVYYDVRAGTNTAAMKFAGASLEEWRKRGHDVHSVIANPMFRAPEKYDFTLSPDSPAVRLGFKPIDIRYVGIRPKQARETK